MKIQLKKVSIFVDSYLRKRLEDKESQLLAQAFGHAVMFPTILVQFLSTGFHQSEKLPEELRNIFRAQSDNIDNAFEKALRIESTLTVFAMDVIRVRTAFFKRGQKNPFYELRVYLDSSGKSVGGVTGVSMHN